MTSSIPIIDVFAGPGGLGEGFSALGRKAGKPYFKIGVSVEKEASAHSTLELRSFYRQFPYGEVPEDYYSFLRGDISRDELFKRHPAEALAAKDEAWLDALGSGPVFDAKLDERISSVIAGHDKWILIGGPPCQAYSVIGRSRNIGIKDYKIEDDSRSYLYIEYLRIIAKHQPPVFVMENVKGILSSKVQGKSVFDSILADLQNPASVFSGFENETSFKYKIFSLVKPPEESGTSHLPEDYIVKCERYGIPQARHRVILLGIREDLASVMPETIQAKDQVCTESVLNGLPALRSGLSREADSQELWLQRFAGIADQQWVKDSAEKYGHDFHGRLMAALSSPIHSLHDRGDDRFVRYEPTVRDELKWWYLDLRMGGVCNHSTRGHIFNDLQRYLFASCYAQTTVSPGLRDYPPELLPNHKNATSGHFNDRFRVQAFGRPSSTITSHISKDGHYYIHPDPRQCRSLTVREAARLQT
ncbi:MAG: DNA cytosine methyltransferase, partial [Gemmatimonadaceae bacterium]|nr:DNA cytosine methyltransferase [Chitinophagaceae bacterium]